MTKIAYVTTAHSKVNNFSEVRVYYTNGRNRLYKPETMPNTVMDFCITSKHCDEDETACETTKTYW